MKKVPIVVLGFVLIGVLSTSLIIYMHEDKEGPAIQVSIPDITYTEGNDTKELLQGVTAVDTKDGDVSDSLIIESIIPLRQNTTARVTYAAKDKSSRITKKSIIINYIPRPVEMTEVTEEMNNEVASVESIKVNDEEIRKDEQKQVDTVGIKTVETLAEKEEVETGKEMENTKSVADNESKENEAAETSEVKTTDVENIKSNKTLEGAELIQGDPPTISLSTTEIKLKIGAILNPFDYVAEVTDDKDSREYIYRRVRIEGFHNMKKAGTYILEYYCTDSDQNRSTSKFLKIYVLE